MQSHHTTQRKRRKSQHSSGRTTSWDACSRSSGKHASSDNLKNSTYFAHYCSRTYRLCVPDIITLVQIRELRSLWTDEIVYAAPISDDAPQIDPENWLKTMKSIALWFERHLGVNVVSLSHLLQLHDVIIQENGDPRKGELNSKYTIYKYEMVSYPLHFVGKTAAPYIEDFAIDNRFGWKLIMKVCNEYHCWTIIRPWQRAKYTKGVLHALGYHHLG